MHFKNILVPVPGANNDSDAKALESAFNLATRFGAHVNALHIKIDPRSAAAFVGEGMTSTMIESVIDNRGKGRRRTTPPPTGTTQGKSRPHGRAG